MTDLDDTRREFHDALKSNEATALRKAVRYIGNLEAEMEQVTDDECEKLREEVKRLTEERDKANRQAEFWKTSAHDWEESRQRQVEWKESLRRRAKKAEAEVTRLTEERSRLLEEHDEYANTCDEYIDKNKCLREEVTRLEGERDNWKKRFTDEWGDDLC